MKRGMMLHQGKNFAVVCVDGKQWVDADEFTNVHADLIDAEAKLAKVRQHVRSTIDFEDDPELFLLLDIAPEGAKEAAAILEERTS